LPGKQCPESVAVLPSLDDSERIAAARFDVGEFCLIATEQLIAPPPLAVDHLLICCTSGALKDASLMQFYRNDAEALDQEWSG
jgi:hypothetical protein